LNITGGTAPYTIHWSNGANTASIANLSAGGYTVTVTDANNCEAVSLVHVQPDNTIPVAGFTHTLTGGNIALENTATNADSIYWDIGDGSGVSNVADPTHTYAAEGIYEVCLTAFNTCGSAQKCVTINTITTTIENIAGDNVALYPNP